MYLQFSSLFVLSDASKYETRNEGVYKDYISWTHILLDKLILMVEMKQSWQYWHSYIVESLWKTLLNSLER